MAEPLPQEVIDALLNDSGNFQVNRAWEDLARPPHSPSEKIDLAFEAIPQERGDYIDLSSGTPVPRQFSPLYTGRVNNAGVQAFIDNALASQNIEDRRGQGLIDSLKGFVKGGQFDFSGRGLREVSDDEWDADQMQGMDALYDLMKLSR